MKAQGLHRAGALANTSLLLCLVGSTLAARTILVPLAGLAVVFFLALASGERPTKLVPLRAFVFLFALLLFVAQVLSVRTGTIVIPSPVRVTSDGLVSGARMSSRFLAILCASALFVRTTDPDGLAGALIRLRIPYRYAHLIILALRFVPFFQGELHSIRDAQRVRGIRVSVRGPRRILSAARYTFIPVLVSGLQRVDSMAISMKGRCFGLYSTRTPSRQEKWSHWSEVALLFGLGIVGLAVAAGHWGWKP
jgi:energy-coupling factor transport system permease protein